MSLDDRGETFEETTGRGGVIGSGAVSAEALLPGDRPRPRSAFLNLLAEGDGDLDELGIHCVRVRLRSVSATDRLGVFGLSARSRVWVVNACAAPFSVKSSEETVTLGVESFFLTFRDALRNMCLLALCAEPLALADVSEDSERTFSEKVRLIPPSEPPACAPGI